MRRPVAAVVGIANEQVPIAVAANLVGLELPTDETYSKSWKVFCPFGELYHTDGGAEKAMRVYPDSNTAHCFAGCGFFTPVRLVSHAWGRPQAEVARDLLERAGVKTATLRERFAAARDWHPPPDTTLLAEALKTFCRRLAPDWNTRQFDQDVAWRLTACLNLLTLVSTDADAALWLERCKQVMAKALASPGVDKTHESSVPS